jgi:hypothetical protein
MKSCIPRIHGARPALPKLVILLLLRMCNFLLLCMFRSLYSVYCLCVNVYCSTATRCQPNCSEKKIYILRQDPCTGKRESHLLSTVIHVVMHKIACSVNLLFQMK